MSMRGDGDADWAALRVLAEPNRRLIFGAVRRAAAPLTRDEVADRTGLSRRLVTFHLDRLAEAGLLLVDYARPSGRRAGPGAGRPPKRYRAGAEAIAASDPPRRYELVAQILARAIARCPEAPAGEAAAVARAEGRRVGDGQRAAGEGAPLDARVRGVLDDLGYEATCRGDGRVTLCNCPFRSVAESEPELVCGVNLEFLRGVLEAIEVDPGRAALQPESGRCCVTVDLAP